jgi:DNA-binding MarR family transcriptional regulator
MSVATPRGQEADPAAPAPDGPAAPPVDAAEQLGTAFRGVIAATRRLRGRETHHPSELSYAQYLLLFGLAEGSERSARELAESADLSAATVAQMLDSLAAAGLVERVRSERDKRIVLTSLTERGCAVVRARREQMEPRWRAALEEFSDEQLLTAAAVLDRLHALFEAFAEENVACAAPESGTE